MSGYGSKYKPAKRDRFNEGPAEGDHNSNWAISYGDMITLLLAFFVLFFSLEEQNKDIDILNRKIKEEYQKESKQADSQWGAKQVEKKERKPSNALEEIAEELPEVTTEIQGNKMIIQFQEISFFNSAEYVLTKEGEGALQRFAAVFKDVRGRLRLVVRGYTDNRPVKSGKTYKDNMELSALRAISALRALKSNGVPFHLMRIGGYGETDKSKVITEKDKRKFDRKVVLVVEPLDQTERGFDDFSRVPSSAPEETQKEKKNKENAS